MVEELSYRSNDNVSPIDISRGEFIFVFDYKNTDKSLEETDLIEGTNFHLVFGLEDAASSNTTSIKITNCIPSETSEDYRFNESIEYTLKKNPLTVTDRFFNDNLYFFDGVPYKLIDENDKSADNFKIEGDKTYIKTNKFSLVTFEGESYIKRLNEKNNEDKYIRPMEVCWVSTKDSANIEYYTDKANIFDANLSHTYKFVVSDGGKVISLWKENKEGTFENIKTFSFTTRMENAFITLKINEELKNKLSNFRFSFFKSHVK